jgi:hypothetical protein
MNVTATADRLRTRDEIDAVLPVLLAAATRIQSALHRDDDDDERLRPLAHEPGERTRRRQGHRLRAVLPARRYVGVVLAEAQAIAPLACAQPEQAPDGRGMGDSVCAAALP